MSLSTQLNVIPLKHPLSVPEKPGIVLGRYARISNQRNSATVSWLLAFIRYQIHTLILFTYSDFKNVLIPKTLCGLLGALSSSLLTTPAPLSVVLARAPLVAIWTWLNLLPFAISNQRQPFAIEEDVRNKPWRPLPQRRLSPEQAKRLMIALYIVAFLASLLLGGVPSFVAAVILGCWYNELGGADSSCVIRYLLNAGLYVSMIVGTIDVATKSEVSFLPRAHLWFFLIGVIIFSTAQMHDFADQSGDKARGRLTLPLVVGDNNARWSFAILIPTWSVIAGRFWQLNGTSLAVPVMLGFIISICILRNRSKAGDKLTYRIWNMWLIVLYALPLAASMEL